MAENRNYQREPSEAPPIGMQGRLGGGPGRFMPKERAKNAKGTFVKLLRFYVKEAKALFAVSGLLLAAAVIGVFAPYLIGKSVDAMTVEGGVDLPLVYQYGAAVLTIYVSVWLLNITQGLLMNTVSQRIVRTLRGSLFDKMQRLPLMYHDTHSHGELMSRLTNDIDNISGTIAQSTTELISASVTVAGSLVMMLILSPILTAVSMTTVPLVLLITRLISRRSREMFAGQQRELGRLNGLIEESITGRRMVLAFDMRDKMVDSFRENNREMKEYAVRAQIWSGLLMPFMNVITNLGYVGVMFAGGLLAAGSPALIGTVASFGTYSRQFAFPLNNIAGMFNNLQSALAGAERVFEVMEEADEPEDLPGAVDIGVPEGAVAFQNVSFAYVPGVNVLNNVSFQVKPGQKVALVGETGAGKTTIVNLLTRF
ncbi:MAG: ABC transporter ATP-binding protein, partial [Oscillospiraceae bacterium]|nr:ABC transporter ATP-binding protein [Oscillospiraceae bacterium]